MSCIHLVLSGHYKAFLWNENEKQWKKDEAMGIHVAVEVRFSDSGDKPLLRLDAMQELATSHIVVDTRGPPEGRFTFTSHEPGASCIRLPAFSC